MFGNVGKGSEEVQEVGIMHIKKREHAQLHAQSIPMHINEQHTRAKMQESSK
jgi:hypothetical protein